MSKLGNAVSAMKWAADNLLNSSIYLNSTRSNFSGKNPPSCGNITYRPCAINLIQTRHRHVMDDAMEPYRTFRHDKKTGVKTSSPIIFKKFFRLRWGGWIRTVRNKDAEDMWRRTLVQKRHYKQHVFCTAKQSRKFDRMTSDEDKEPHYYVDDPYEPYHSKEEFMHTRTKPLPPSKNAYQYLDD